MNRRTTNKIFLLLVTVNLLLIGCSGTRNLPEGQVLYTGADLVIVSSTKIEKESRLKSEVLKNIKPEHNRKFLGNRPRVWIYNGIRDTTGKKFKTWLKTKIGAKPVTMDDVDVTSNITRIGDQLFNNGFFDNTVTSKVVEGKRTASIEYTLNLHAPFIISDVSMRDSSVTPVFALKEIVSGSKLTGQPYMLVNVRTELRRIEDEMRNRGYYYFVKENVYFTADTNRTERTVKLELLLKDGLTDELKTFKIGDIKVNTDYELGKSDSLIFYPDSSRRAKFTPNSSVRPRVISRSIFLKKGETYSRMNHEMTISRLMGMGTYQFVRIRYLPVDSGDTSYLNVVIELTPGRKKSIQSELDAISKSNDFVGPALSFSFLNRNAFNGAEALKISLKSSLETQFKGSGENVFGYEFSPQIELKLPRLITGIRIPIVRGYYIPKTVISFNYNFLKRVGFYNLNSFQFNYGYQWRMNLRISHELNPISVNYFSVAKRTDQFNLLIADNLFLKRTFENQFIPALYYSFTFNEHVIPTQRSQFYLRFTSEFAGNLFSLINKSFLGKERTNGEQFTAAGVPYSQFSRFTLDMNNYYNITKQDQVILRLYAGVGIPYGNSSSLPYVRQFFSGGPSSIRAFRINALGPGATLPDTIRYSILRSGGDFKLETNLEYRFPIYKIVKGAVFADAGNIWVFHDPATGETFNFNKVLSEFAVGTGFGIRFDASFFILRFDLAIPLRKPWLSEGERWVADEIQLGSGKWRGDNLLFNIAIGYPF
jgi:outer membrane protein insertion porin family